MCGKHGMTRTTLTKDEREMHRLSILQVCDSVFPIGAFALSNGMETFVQRDMLRSPEDFEQYLKNYLEVAAYKEIGQMVIAGKIALDARLSDIGFTSRIRELDELCTALQSAREIREGQTRMCLRMIKLADQMEDQPLQPVDMRQAQSDRDAISHEPTSEGNRRTIHHLDRYKELIDSGACVGLHSIAMGLFAADKAPSLREAAVTYCYSLLSALTVCAVKAVPISQYAGQVALNRAFPEIVAAVDLAFTLKPDDLGISGAYLDIAAMQHETLYSRLYMS
jgi:urease accessory protein